MLTFAHSLSSKVENLQSFFMLLPACGCVVDLMPRKSLGYLQEIVLAGGI